MTKAIYGARGYFSLQFHITVHHQRKAGQEPGAGADAEAREDTAYWLAPHGLFSLLYYSTQDHQPRGGPTYKGLKRPKSIIDLENTPTDLPTG